MENTFQDISKITFSGLLEELVFSDLISKIEHWLNQKREKSIIKRKIIAISIEVLQNILTHGFGKYGKFTLVKGESVYSILTENWISNEKRIYLEDEIAKINNYTSEQLNNEIDRKLLIELDPNKNGAGIGLLYLKKVTNGKIRLTELKEDEGRTLISIAVEVDRFVQRKINHASLLNLNITDSSLSYEGAITDIVITNLVVEIDNWLKAKQEKIATKRKILTSCVEILQNVSKHSQKKSGFIVLSYNPSFYEVSVGSFVSKEESKNISWEIEKIKFYTKSELYQKTNNKLANMQSGLGLLNVIAFTNKNLNINFKSSDNEDLLMVINFKIETATTYLN